MPPSLINVRGAPPPPPGRPRNGRRSTVAPPLLSAEVFEANMEEMERRQRAARHLFALALFGCLGCCAGRKIAKFVAKSRKRAEKAALKEESSKETEMQGMVVFVGVPVNTV